MTRELFFNLLYLWIALALIVFPIMLKVTVPYGRHTTNRWDPTLRNKWGWLIMELPVLLIFSWFFFTGMHINLKSDNRLLALRKGGKKGYYILTGFFLSTYHPQTC